jgi:hypothetical protein
MRYFHKEIVTNKIYLPTGDTFPFEHIGDFNGVLQTESDVIINEAEKLIREGRGGVTSITKLEYDELIKKKSDLPQPGFFQREHLGTSPSVLPQHLSPFLSQSSPAAVAAAAPVPPITERPDSEGKPEPVRVPRATEFKKPGTRKA